MTIPTVYKVLKHDFVIDGVFYKRHEHRIVIDAPFDVYFSQEAIGFQFQEDDHLFLGGSPIFLRPDAFTQTEIDGKLYTVVIRETYEEVGDIKFTLEDNVDKEITDEEIEEKIIKPFKPLTPEEQKEIEKSVQNAEEEFFCEDKSELLLKYKLKMLRLKIIVKDLILDIDGIYNDYTRHKFEKGLILILAEIG